MYICTCTFCVVRHRDVYGVSNMEKLTSVTGVAGATHGVC